MHDPTTPEGWARYYAERAQHAEPRQPALPSIPTPPRPPRPSTTERNSMNITDPATARAQGEALLAAGAASPVPQLAGPLRLRGAEWNMAGDQLAAALGEHDRAQIALAGTVTPGVVIAIATTVQAEEGAEEQTAEVAVAMVRDVTDFAGGPYTLRLANPEPSDDDELIDFPLLDNLSPVVIIP